MVLVPARVAFLLGRHGKFDELRIQVRGQDREVDEVLLDWHTVVLRYRDRESACGSTSSVAEQPQVVGTSERCQPLSSRQVADAAGTTVAAVTLAVRERRLVGSKVGCRWLFEREDVDAWIATRKAS